MVPSSHRPVSARVLPVFAVALLTSCSFRPAIPEGAQLQCLDSSECPPGLFCNPLRRCVTAAELARVIPLPRVAPSLVPHGGQTAVKLGDLLDVQGTADVGATLLSARLMSLTDPSWEKPLEKGTVVLDEAGVLHGKLVAAGLRDKDQLSLEVLVATPGAGSDPEKSRSPGVPVDLVKPTQLNA